jgi:hypothetical protein
MWSWRSRMGCAASIAVGGRFLFLDERGRLSSMPIDPRQPAGHSMIDQPVLAAPCFTAPALHRGLLYLRNEKTLLCLDLRGSA